MLGGLRLWSPRWVGAHSGSGEPPLFDTRFRFHADKCAVYYRLAAAGARFEVLPRVFLLSPPNTPSMVRRKAELPDGDVWAAAAGSALLECYQDELTRFFSRADSPTDELSPTISQ